MEVFFYTLAITAIGVICFFVGYTTAKRDARDRELNELLRGETQRHAVRNWLEPDEAWPRHGDSPARSYTKKDER